MGETPIETPSFPAAITVAACKALKFNAKFRMAKHLSGKTSRLISDFLTIVELTDFIEHEMEKRIVARHGLVKIDAILKIAPRLKNEVKSRIPNGTVAVRQLESLLSRLRNDYEGSGLEIGRDAMSAHALHLDLQRIVDTWSFMNKTVFAVLADDLREIDRELAQLDPNYPQAVTPLLDKSWKAAWSSENLLGSPSRPRMAIIYGGLATAGISTAVPGGAPAQDATIRVGGLMTFINQIDRLVTPVGTGNGTVNRLFAEMLLIDFCALWEALFTSGVANEHGTQEPSLLEHWRTNGWGGVTELEALEQSPHPDLHQWREKVRNRVAAHMDPDIDIWQADLANWPMTYAMLQSEAYRVLNAIHAASRNEIRARAFFIPPISMSDDVIGLAAQEGRHWDET